MYPLRFLLVVLILTSGCEGSTDPTGDGGEIPAGEVAVVEAYPGLSFERPVGVYSVPDGSGRLFVVEQGGLMRGFADDPGAGAAPVFMDLRDRVNDGGNEEGLLGLAFHPDFDGNGRFYLDYTAANPRRTVLAEYRVDSVDPDRGNPGTERVILEIPQPFSNHNGGQIAFGPDGFLYLALGDGGGAGDPEGNGQDPTSLLGSILRIDVDHPDPGKPYGIPSDNPFVGNTQGYREEIFAYGFRNPWRFSFDPETGALWTGDVGQNRTEEIDVVAKGGNYGWNVMEGSACYAPSSGCDRSGLTLPVAEYGRDQGFSVTGGFVYRGSAIPGLEGQYLFADFGTGRIWALDAGDPGASQAREILRTDLNIASFGVDGAGEILLCAFDGRIYRLAEAGG
jgi:glucose/arabinose dehydrogenase